MGIFKPKIVLPVGMDLQGEKIGYILAHEFCHIKRLDALWKLLAVGAVCIHWFNPLVWIAFVLAGRDLEISCDAWVVRKFGEHAKKTYAYALIEVVEYQNEFTPFYSNFAQHAIKERVESLMKVKKATRLGIGVATVLVGILILNAFASSATVTDEDEMIVGGSAEIESENDLNDNYFDIEAIYKELIDVNTGDMTFRVGDITLGERNDFILPEDYFGIEEVSILLANEIYERLGISVDNTIFDIYVEPFYERLIWSGWILNPEHLIDLGEAHTQHILLHFSIFADTGELRFINHHKDGKWTIYDGDWIVME